MTTFLAMLSFYSIIQFSISDFILDDIQEGDCLSMEEIQGLTGVSEAKVYQAGQCNVDYETSNNLTDELACGLGLTLEMPGGEWSRTIKEHKKPGFFWPKPVPCMTSVVDLQKEVYRHEFISEESSCSAEQTYVRFYQTESLKTKRYKAGQGELFLPSPLLVHQESFVHDGQESLLSTCENKSLTAKYRGMGKIQLRLEKQHCSDSSPYQCQIMDVSPKKDSEGHTCAYIERLWDCP